MKQALASVANKFFTAVAKKLVLTNCSWICHRADAPEELFK
ncbi:AgrD family cyclic lactone autoinducer peptide [Paenibacillus chitinolyticus]